MTLFLYRTYVDVLFRCCLGGEGVQVCRCAGLLRSWWCEILGDFGGCVWCPGDAWVYEEHAGAFLTLWGVLGSDDNVLRRWSRCVDLWGRISVNRTGEECPSAPYLPGCLLPVTSLHAHMHDVVLVFIWLPVIVLFSMIFDSDFVLHLNWISSLYHIFFNLNISVCCGKHYFAIFQDDIWK